MAQSAIAAIIARYASITMPSLPKPPLWFDGVPQTNAAGSTQNLPYVNLIDEGMAVEYDFEHTPLETLKFRFEVWANTLVTVDLIVAGLKYGSGGLTDGLGYDFATFSISGQHLMECVRDSEQRHGVTEPSATGGQVYLCTMGYHLQSQVT